VSPSSAAVEAALDQRRRQLNELRTGVRNAETKVKSLRERADAAEGEKLRFEQQLSNVKEELELTLVMRILFVPELLHL